MLAFHSFVTKLILYFIISVQDIHISFYLNNTKVQGCFAANLPNNKIFGNHKSGRISLLPTCNYYLENSLQTLLLPPCRVTSSSGTLLQEATLRDHIQYSTLALPRTPILARDEHVGSCSTPSSMARPQLAVRSCRTCSMKTRKLKIANDTVPL